MPSYITENKILLASLTAQIASYDSNNASPLAEYILVLIKNESSTEKLYQEVSSFVGGRSATLIIEWLDEEMKRLGLLNSNLKDDIKDARSIIEKNRKSNSTNSEIANEIRPSRGLEDLEAKDLQPLVIAKPVKCPHFPHCHDTACAFAHPSELCKFFPNCQYGSACLYVHPLLPCRFQGKCKNSTCNYQHVLPASGKHYASTLPLVNCSGARLKSTVVCRFADGCKNENCPFVHPVKYPCRLGLKCTDGTCPFEHAFERSSLKYSKINVPCRFGKRCAKADCPYLHNNFSNSIVGSEASSLNSQ